MDLVRTAGGNPEGDAWLSRTRRVYLNNGAGFENQRSEFYENSLPDNHHLADYPYYYADPYEGRRYTDLTVAATGAMFIDINGDGSDDFISNYRGYVGMPHLKAVYLNQSTVPPNLITRITGSFGDVSTVEYTSLLDREVYTKGTVDTNLNRKTTPELDLQMSMRVVKRVSNSNGIGGVVSSKYQYSGLKAHLQGHGSLGFKTMTVTDEQSGVKLKTEYAQHPDYAGMALRLTKTKANGQTMSDAINTPAVIVTDGNDNGSRSLFAYVASSEEKTYDIDSGELLKTETITTNYNGAENGGHYGNPTQVSTHTVNETVPGESFTVTTENRYLPAVKTSQWILGRLYWSKTTRSQNGQTDANAERVSSFTYNSNGVLKSETILPDDTEEVLTTLKQHDVYGNITKQTVCNTVASACAHDTGSARTITTQYDSRGRFPTRMTNALGQSEDYSYDSTFGVRTSLTGPNQLTTHWYYDNYGRQAREVRADGTETVTSRQYCFSNCPSVRGVRAYYVVTTTQTATAPVTEYYDNHQRKIRVTTTGFSGQTIYTDTTYDGKGRAEKVSAPYEFGESPVWTTTVYDDYSRVMRIDYPIGDIDGDSQDNGMRSRSYTYSGYRKTETDAKNRSVTELSNAIGKTVSVTDAGGQTIRYQYNSQGDLKNTIDPNNNQISIRYNDRGLKTHTTDPDMGSWTYAYNGFGELTRQTDAKGQTITLAYDKLGRMISRTEGEGTSTWTYGSVFSSDNRNIGKLIQSTGPQNNENNTYRYDSLGRSVSTTQTLSIAPYINNQSYTHSQTYNSATGRVDTIRYPHVNGQQLQVKHVYNVSALLTTPYRRLFD